MRSSNSLDRLDTVFDEGLVADAGPSASRAHRPVRAHGATGPTEPAEAIEPVDTVRGRL